MSHFTAENVKEQPRQSGKHKRAYKLSHDKVTNVHEQTCHMTLVENKNEQACHMTSGKCQGTNMSHDKVKNISQKTCHITKWPIT